MENDTRSKDSQSGFHRNLSEPDERIQRVLVFFRLNVVCAKGYDHDVHRRSAGHCDTSVHRLYGFFRNDGTDIATAITDIYGVRYDCQSFDYGKNILHFVKKKSKKGEISFKR